MNNSDPLNNNNHFNDDNFLIITPNCEEPFLVSYFIAGIIPFAFFFFFVSFFFPSKKITLIDLKNKIEELDFKDINSLALVRFRIFSIILTLLTIAILFTQVFIYNPMIIVYSNTTALAFDPFIYYTLMFLISSFLLLCNLICRFKLNLKKEEILYFAFFIFSSLIILFQFNLIGIFICLELFSISSYLLVTGLGRKVSIEGAIKYSLTGLLGTVFFLLGITFCIVNFNCVNIHLLELYFRYAIVEDE